MRFLSPTGLESTLVSAVYASSYSSNDSLLSRMPIILQISVYVRLATSLEVVFMSSGVAGEGSVCCPVLMGFGCAALELRALKGRVGCVHG